MADLSNLWKKKLSHCLEYLNLHQKWPDEVHGLIETDRALGGVFVRLAGARFKEHLERNLGMFLYFFYHVWFPRYNFPAAVCTG